MLSVCFFYILFYLFLQTFVTGGSQGVRLRASDYTDASSWLEKFKI